MVNVNRSKFSKYQLLLTAIQSVISNGTEKYTEALKKRIHWEVQWIGAVSFASAYRTVSEPLILFTAGVIMPVLLPFILLARERQAICRRKGQAGEENSTKGERSSWVRVLLFWEQEPRGKWTARLRRLRETMRLTPFAVSVPISVRCERRRWSSVCMSQE